MVVGGATEAAPSPAGALDTAVTGEVESTPGVGSGRRVSVVREPNSTSGTARRHWSGTEPQKITQYGKRK